MTDNHALLTDLLGPLDGARTPGGCAHCNAYQTVHPLERGVWQINVYHDTWCRWLTDREARPADR